ncbi:hypothetical protein HN954_03410, partial [bacterium]|nr:hypothetical protein [bacterium]MBT6996450.1 hypothetical protein [bacterium]
ITNFSQEWTESAGILAPTTGADDVAIDTNTFFVDVSEDRVGIGTTSPENTLHVYDPSGPVLKLSGDGNSDDLTIQFSDFHRIQSNINDGTLDIEAGHAGSGHNIRFFTDDNEKMVIKNTGKVGIGTISPSTKLDVAGSLKVATDSLVPGSLTDCAAASDGGKIEYVEVDNVGAFWGCLRTGASDWYWVHLDLFAQ